MIEFIKVIAKTPNDEKKEYMFMGDLCNPFDTNRLSKFITDCRNDCADYYGVPDEWDADEWYSKSKTEWEVIKY